MAALLAFLLFGEELDLVQILGVVLAAGGVALADGWQRGFDTRAAWKSTKKVLDLARGISHRSGMERGGDNRRLPWKAT